MGVQLLKLHLAKLGTDATQTKNANKIKIKDKGRLNDAAGQWTK